MNTSKVCRFFLFAAVLLALTGCAAEPAASETSEPASEPAAETAVTTSTEGGTPIQAEGLNFNLPAGWTPEQPSSSMRIGQAVIPGSGGDGQLTVFFFGPGGGGGAEANIGRWVAQVDSSGVEPAREAFQANGLGVTWIDTTGTLKKSSIGSFPTEDMPGYRLFGAVVEGDGGPWFLKAVGPEATMAEQREAFIAMLQGATTG